MTEHQSASSHPSPRATAAGIGAIILWCTSGACIAIGSRALGIMPYLAVTSAIGVVTGVGIQISRRRSVIDLFALPPRVAVAGFVGIVVYTILLTTGIQMAREQDLGQIVLINYLWPIEIALLSVLLLRERVRVSLAIGGAALGFIGVVIARGMDTFTSPPESFVPHVLAFAGALLWALYSVLLRRWHVPEERGGSTLQWALCAVLCATVATARGEWSQIDHVPMGVVLWLVFAGIGPVGFAYTWWEIGVKRGAVHLIAALAYFIPIGSALLIAFIYREALSLGLLPGAGLITAGAYLAHRAKGI